MFNQDLQHLKIYLETEINVIENNSLNNLESCLNNPKYQTFKQVLKFINNDLRY